MATFWRPLAPLYNKNIVWDIYTEWITSYIAQANLIKYLNCRQSPTYLRICTQLNFAGKSAVNA